jgi:ABC-2 type transport system permease protein
MIRNLVRKDLRGRYKGSVLGFLWTFVNPLLQLGVYTLIFSTILPNEIEDFYIYLFVALVPWIFFSSSLSGGCQAVLGQKDLVKKVYFPKEVLPISYVSVCFVNMLFTFVIIFLVLLIAGYPFLGPQLLLLPLVMAVEYLLSLGVAFISAAVTVYFRDLEHILGIVTMALFYFTPIVYPPDVIPARLQPLFSLNPMSHITAAYRDILYDCKMPSMRTLFYGFLLGVAVLIIGYIVFQLLKKHFAEDL